MQEVGKSTLVKFIIKALQVDEDKVVYTSFTGKACQVLQKKGNKNVSTLHKLLYNFIPLSNGTFIKTPKEELEYEIVVVDEVSMAPMEMMKQLFQYENIYVLCLGDPFQLPPVDKEADNHLLDSPHIFLDEIMRQAAESEIIQLSMKIREGQKIEPFKGEEVQIVSKEEMTTGMLLWADQILVATNATRININKQMRNLLGREKSPQDGDKVICLRNYWDTISSNGEPLVNGTIGYLKNSYETFSYLPRWAGCQQNKIDYIHSDFITDSNEIHSNLNMDKKQIMEGEKTLSNRDSYVLSRNWKTQNLVPFDFTYGYAITRT